MGHYTSLMRRGRDWFFCDDASVVRAGASSLKVDGFVPVTQHVNFRIVGEPEWGTTPRWCAAAAVGSSATTHPWFTLDPEP